MKNMTPIALTTVATLLLLSGGVAQANPWGGSRIDYNNSFNTSNRTATQVDNSQRFNRDYRLNYKLDNSARTKINNDTRVDLKYDYRSDKLDATQNLNQFRNYNSAVNQTGFNAGSATGHSMNQSQGGTAVGSLSSEANSSRHQGHSLLSPSYSYNAGAVAKGNMSNSQIGGIQSGMQVGDVTNLQSNNQTQDATSGVASSDTVSNSAAK